jgi:hypothetical protein
MTKTQKTRKNRRSHSLPKNAYTFIGLHHWFEETCDKLGWVVLGKGKGYDHKVMEYKRTLQHISDSIEHVMREYKDEDKKHDLKVLHIHVSYLMNFVNKHLL